MRDQERYTVMHANTTKWHGARGASHRCHPGESCDRVCSSVDHDAEKPLPARRRPPNKPRPSTRRSSVARTRL